MIARGPGRVSEGWEGERVGCLGPTGEGTFSKGFHCGRGHDEWGVRAKTGQGGLKGSWKWREPKVWSPLLGDEGPVGEVEGEGPPGRTGV